MMQKNQLYNGFKVLDVVDIAECHATGIWLTHVRTGMQVFHLLNDDEENLFAFAFGTPPKDSTGAAHVLEHSVLCGSEKYPVKDPFIRLANQSVKTYLNAYTSSDKTVFPASSQVKADYFNLMAVYGDAVFFPRLLPEIFMQEAHRLEYDADGKPTIQGVVYNEMKGAYSSFEGLINDLCDKAMLDGTYFVKDSGGDPLIIPSLTLSQLRAFHKKYYCPANCFVFLCGNIPTEEQLAFLDSNIMCRLKDAGKRAVYKGAVSNKPIKPYIYEYGPADDDEHNSETKSSVLLNWNTTQLEKDGKASFTRVMENLFLSELLWGDDSAPVAKALLQSGLGQDIAPQAGCIAEPKPNYLTCGMRGVERKNAKKVQKVINDTLKSICKNGVAADDIDRTVMTFDFNYREIKRINGPFSLVYLRRCIKGWQNQTTPWAYLCIIKQFNEMKKKIQSDPDYIISLIKKLLVENKKHSLLVVTPSNAWSRKRAAEERKIARMQASKTTKQKILSDLEKLHSYQQTPETMQAISCIPHLKLSDLTIKADRIDTKISEVQGIPYFVNKENTNGIVYVDIAFPVDVLSPADYPYVAALAPITTRMGWGDLNWSEAMQLVGKTMGTFTAYANTSSLPVKNVQLKRWQGRDWLVFFFKTVAENTMKSFQLTADCISKTTFTDYKRLKNLIEGQCNDGAAAVVQSAHYFAALRASRTVDRSSAVAESWYGLSSLFINKELSRMPIKTVASRFERIFSEIKKGGAVIHATADSEGLAAIKKCPPSFIADAGIKPLKQKRRASDAEFFALTAIPDSARVKQKNATKVSAVSSRDEIAADETFIIPGTVGFAASVVKSAPYDTPECMEDAVFTRCMENTTLWEQIRTVGGAYGVMFQPNSECATSTFSTYRDPKPLRSLAILNKCVDEASGTEFSPELVEKTVTGCYSAEIQPKTPSVKGGTGFLWELYCYTNSQQERRLKWLISMSPKKLHFAALRYAASSSHQTTVILCSKLLISGKLSESTGKIFNLPVYYK